MPEYNFNAQGMDAQYGGAGGLPLGRHPVVISASALKPTKDGQGGYLEFEITAIDGPARGGKTFDRLNLHNKSAQAVEIANKQLAAYCHVTGVFAFNQTEQLHNIPFQVEMIARRDNPNQTEIGMIFDANGNEPGKQTQGGGQAQGGNQPPAQGGGAPGWAGGGAASQGGNQPPAQGGGQTWAQGGAAPAGGPGPWGNR